MSINATHAYIFLSGLYIGGYTNTFSNLVITGLITYIIHPNFYTKDKFDVVKNIILGKLSPWLNNYQNNVENNVSKIRRLPINIIKS